MQETIEQYLERLRERLEWEYDAFWELHTRMRLGWKSRYQQSIEKARLNSRPVTWLKEAK